MKTYASLTPAGLERVHQAIEAANGRPVIQGVRATFECLGIDWSKLNHRHTLNPILYAIPQEQWSKIEEWVMLRNQALTPNALTTVNEAMDWINYGPSNFDPDELAARSHHPSWRTPHAG